jgi:hypothetical protein
MARGIDDLYDDIESVGVIIVGMLSECSKKTRLTVTMYLGVSNFQRAISIVIPRSRSAFSLSSTQADQGKKIRAEKRG